MYIKFQPSIQHYCQVFELYDLLDFIAICSDVYGLRTTELVQLLPNKITLVVFILSNKS